MAVCKSLQLLTVHISQDWFCINIFGIISNFRSVVLSNSTTCLYTSGVLCSFSVNYWNVLHEIGTALSRNNQFHRYCTTLCATLSNCPSFLLSFGSIPGSRYQQGSYYSISTYAMVFGVYPVSPSCLIIPFNYLFGNAAIDLISALFIFKNSQTFLGDIFFCLTLVDFLLASLIPCTVML